MQDLNLIEYFLKLSLKPSEAAEPEWKITIHLYLSEPACT